ncbi:hypothetical protein CPB86DRAFT_311446 [Serendipita vermifera]|nr:hypothetical protein CPB86DRAFT_311446 [Serendipita vermifera]
MSTSSSLYAFENGPDSYLGWSSSLLHWTLYRPRILYTHFLLYLGQLMSNQYVFAIGFHQRNMLHCEHRECADLQICLQAILRGPPSFSSPYEFTPNHLSPSYHPLSQTLYTTAPTPSEIEYQSGGYLNHPSTFIPGTSLSLSPEYIPSELQLLSPPPAHTGLYGDQTLHSREPEHGLFARQDYVHRPSSQGAPEASSPFDFHSVIKPEPYEDPDLTDAPTPEDYQNLDRLIHQGMDPKGLKVHPTVTRFIRKHLHSPSERGVGSRNGTRIYECLYAGCGATTKRGDHARDHVLGHVNCNPFMCTQCSRAFRRSHDLKRHKRNSCPRGPAGLENGPNEVWEHSSGDDSSVLDGLNIIC